MADLRELPIIFSGPMIRALQRPIDPKTQTRRTLNPQPTAVEFGRAVDLIDGRWKFQKQRWNVGDRLWVREAFAFIDNSEFRQPSYYQYRADTDGKCLPGDWPDDERDNPDRPKWRPSIHMPRVASRITLEVTRVWVERLQDISEADAKAEGVRVSRGGSGVFVGREGPGDMITPWITAKEAYLDIWDDIHGLHASDANPWVVATEFKRVPQPTNGGSDG